MQKQQQQQQQQKQQQQAHNGTRKYEKQSQTISP